MYRVLEDRGLEATGLDEGDARELYRHMARARRFDERALNLQRRGWMSGYPPFKGQEASQVGAAYAMAEDDWLFPTYRSNAMLLTLGVAMEDILLFRRGFGEFHRETRTQPIFPQAVPIATQIPHATGVGMAANYVDADHGVVCYFGDGATSEGDFHEGLNFAGVFQTPTLFFCENNHWAISVPRERQTASDTLAQKAIAYGFEGEQVDGTDPLAVADLVRTTLDEVRTGTPFMIESLTYRHGAHTTADDPSRYREASNVDDWRMLDPLERFEGYLLEEGIIDEAEVTDWEDTVNAELTEAVNVVESMEPPPPGDMFDDLFESLPTPLRRQRDDVLTRIERSQSTE